MLSSRPAFIAFYAALLIPASILVWLAVVVLQQAVSTGSAEGLMMAWVLVFVLGLPVAMAVLPALSWLRARVRRRQVVPNMGVNIPGAGQ